MSLPTTTPTKAPSRSLSSSTTACSGRGSAVAALGFCGGCILLTSLLPCRDVNPLPLSEVQVPNLALLSEQEQAFYEEDDSQPDTQRSAKRKAPGSWGSAPLKERIATGKLIFLFLLKDGLQHGDVWKAFFEGAPADTVRSFAHCSEKNSCSKLDVFKKLKIVLIPRVESRWCVDLVTPVWALVKAALQATKEDAGLPQKFVLISSSTLPIQTMHQIRRVSFSSHKSEVCVCSPNEWANFTFFGSEFGIAKHHQWMILNREDGEAFVRGWKLAYKFGELQNKSKNFVADWQVPRMGFDGRANFSATIPRPSILAKGRCPDEEVITSTIWGLYEPSRNHLWRDIIRPEACRTYVNWAVSKPPEVFSEVTKTLKAFLEAPERHHYFFARKFSSKADVRELLAFHKAAKAAGKKSFNGTRLRRLNVMTDPA